MSRFKKITVALGLLFVILMVSSYFLVPPILKSVLVKKLSESLHREVTLERIHFNPFTLALSVQGFGIRERGGTESFVSFQELFVNLQILSVAKRALVLDEVKLVKPSVRILRSADGSYNFSDLLEKKPGEEKKEPGKPFLFSVNNIRVIDGRVEFLDNPKDTKHTAENIQAAIPFLSNMAYALETKVEPSFSAVINGTPYTLKGETKPFADSRETEFRISFKDLDIPHYLAYVPMKLNFRLPSAKLDVDSTLTYRQERSKTPALIIKGMAGLRDVVLEDLRKARLIRFPALTVDIAAVEPLLGKIHLAKVVLKEPEVNVRRNAAGEINLLTLAPEKAKDEKKAEEKKGLPAAKTAPTPDKAGPVVDIDELLLEKGTVFFRDETTPQPFSLPLRDIRLEGRSLSTAAGKEGTIDLSIGFPKGGTLSLKGPFTITPVSTKLAIDAKGIDLPGFQPYWMEAVNLHVTGGKIGTRGSLTVSLAEKTPKIRYAGRLMITRFASIDKVQAADFLKWKSLYLNDLDVNVSPLKVQIRQVALTDFYSRVMVYPDATLNVQKIASEKKEEAGKPSAKDEAAGPQAPPKEPAKDGKEKPKAGPDITIDAITLQGGEIDFLDRHIKPTFSGRLVEIGGRIGRMSSREAIQADVDLKGRLDGYAPLEITGKINPLSKDLFVDLKMSFKDMDLSPVTPYSGKYAGYAIEKGKLSFDLKYLIAKRKLESQNVVFIDQLTLGEKVESPQATKLPVSLAISLLKDRHGQIKLDIPVAGTLDDPKFSVWRIIVQVLVNILTKAATAPFALLGSLMGGGEEMSYVEFDAGGIAVGEANIKKLATLGKALQERPALKLDIEGFVDREKDREGLRTTLFQRKIKVQKLNETLKKGAAAVPVDDVKIEPGERDRYLKMAYSAEKFPKPRNIIGMAKSLPPAEMEKLMLTNIEVRDEDLRLLASQRALRVRDVLLKSGDVTPDRVFIVEPKSLTPQKKEKLKNSRVDFRLK
ncbi:MAG: hypothetical protein CVU61_07855 [Deltaproteobacteria bacterium HGW-Deltaproteobacteria-19]|jgi:hypothetical protein|nr:MAG: hypothetical protein CVU61_07855 [Deltaproteobacteria bacterium HGW-Deltaproteobacteria-19]